MRRVAPVSAVGDSDALSCKWQSLEPLYFGLLDFHDEHLVVYDETIDFSAENSGLAGHPMTIMTVMTMIWEPSPGALDSTSALSSRMEKRKAPTGKSQPGWG